MERLLEFCEGFAYKHAMCHRHAVVDSRAWKGVGDEEAAFLGVAYGIKAPR